MISEKLESGIDLNAGRDIHDWALVSRASIPGVPSALRILSRRMIRVISFDTAIYAEVAEDKGATLQALLIVLLSAAASGVSVYVAAGFEGFDRVVSLMYLATVGWVLWVSITYFVGTQIIKKHAPERDWKSLARALGFAQSVGILRILGIIPGLGLALTLAVLLWIFVASILAIRGALGYQSNWRALGVVAISLFPFVPIMAFLSLLMVRS